MKSILLLCVLCALWVPGMAQARDMVVFAAASLKNVMDDITDQFETTTGIDVAVSYAGSSALARQIQQGAPADIFVSANAAWMQQLQDDGLIRAGSVRIVAGNRLVLVAPQEGRTPIANVPADLKPTDRLAMALTEAVPAGIYGKDALVRLGLWDRLSPFVAQTDNVRAALRLVALGEAQFGIVYATDAAVDDKVHVHATFPQDTHPPVRYPAGQVSDSAHPQAAAFLDFLIGDVARGIFDQHGFVTEDLR